MTYYGENLRLRRAVEQIYIIYLQCKKCTIQRRFYRANLSRPIIEN